MANCFSLQKEHDVAIKYLERAIQVILYPLSLFLTNRLVVSNSLKYNDFKFIIFQLQPDFAYAYTLLGHEYVFTDENERALSCFRSALRYNERHYNAW